VQQTRRQTPSFLADVDHGPATLAQIPSPKGVIAWVGFGAHDSVQFDRVRARTLQMVRREVQIRAEAWAAAEVLPDLLPAWLPGREGAGSVQAAAPTVVVVKASGSDGPGGVNYTECVAMQWLVWRDAVAALAPHLERRGIYWAVVQLRSDPTTGGLWAGLPAPWAGQRDELRWQLVELAEAQGDPWPFPDDLPPRLPDKCDVVAFGG
jgi:hypothetical protein